VLLGIFDAAEVGIIRFLMVFMVLFFIFIFEDKGNVSFFSGKIWGSSLLRNFSRLTWGREG